MELQGTISSDFSMLTSIEQLILSNNTLSGTLPNELTSLPNLKILDVSNNHLSVRVPYFMQNMIVNTDGIPILEKMLVLLRQELLQVTAESRIMRNRI